VGNWKQLQARIRKARVGADAAAKLEQLFLKTRDAMVAFELGKVHEQGQREDQAVEWYRKAYERFRREEWRVKAAEAIQRLGGTPPVPGESAPAAGPQDLDREQEPAAPASVPTPRGWAALPDHLFHSPEASEGAADDESRESQAEATEEPAGIEPGNAPAPESEGTRGRAAEPTADGKRRRRGRRGGRRHRRGGHAEHAVVASAPQTPKESAPPAPPPRMPPPVPPRTEPAEESGWLGARAEEYRTRAGDPGLASRVARLEMQVRRLLACPPQKVTDSDLAPAGPGVLLLSDSDLTTHYYICACDTLRIEIGRMTRSDRGSRSRGREQHPALRGRLAEHLEISESQAVKYLETHCVVRWLQLDEGAPRVAHFAIAALEPILNE